MKKVLLKLIDLYQKMPLRSHSKCRFYPTCSNYAIESIKIHGSLKCNPFHKGGIDLVPSRNNSCKIK